MIARAVLILLALLVAACTPEDQETGSIRGEDVRQARQDLPPEVVAAIDSGNAAYRRGEYREALEAYRHAVAQEEDVAAGWFGVYMAELALGNTEAADSALERARTLQPGATLIHPERDTTP